jgi:hypothetical protein
MYFVIELQTNNGQTAYLVTSHATRAEAESKYHTVLSAAAVSSVEKHAAILVSDEGFPLMNQCYIHNAE